MFIKSFRVNDVLIKTDRIDSAISAYCNRIGLHNLKDGEELIVKQNYKVVGKFKIIKKEEQYPKLKRIK